MKQRQLTQRYNAESGEVVYSKDEDINSFDRFKDGNKGYLFIANNRKLIHSRSPGWPKDLSSKDKGQLWDLCERLETNGIIMDRQFPLKRSGIAKLLQLHRNSVNALLGRLTALGVARWHEDALYINPLYVAASSYLPPDLYSVFQQELNPHLPPWVIDKFRILGGLADGT